MTSIIPAFDVELMTLNILSLVVFITETAEYPIAIRVQGIMPNSTAHLHYRLEINGEIHEFTTIVKIGSFQPREEIPINPIFIIIFFIVVVILYIFYNQLKHRKR